MARPDHVPTPESGEQVSPTQSTGTESEGVEEDQNFTKRENGQWRSQDIRLDIIHRLLLLLLSHVSRVRLCATHRRQPTRLPRPWDSPGKNTGVGRHFLLQCMRVKSESEVAQSCPTLSDPMDCSPPGSSIHGIFPARVLEWGAIAFSEYRG